MSTQAPSELDLLQRLTAGRWLMPILGELGRGADARFGVLVRRLDISRSRLAASLDRLEAEGWIRRNPGHGHPLRPEYLLTTEGRLAARSALEILSCLDAQALAPAALGRWGLPILRALMGGSDRFGDLQKCLAPATPRALSMALDQLEAIRLVARRSRPARHPRYELTARGRRIAGRLSPSCFPAG